MVYYNYKHKGEREMESVNKPVHYIGENGMEVEDVLRNFIPRYADSYVGHRIASAVEYLLRAPLKNRSEDMRKAIRNIEMALEYLDQPFEAEDGDDEILTYEEVQELSSIAGNKIVAMNTKIDLSKMEAWIFGERYVLRKPNEDGGWHTDYDDLPEHGVDVIVLTDLDSVSIANYNHKLERWEDAYGEPDVKAWQYFEALEGDQ